MDPAILVAGAIMALLGAIVAVGVAFLCSDKGDARPLTLCELAPLGSGTDLPPNALTIRELTKPRRDIVYRAQVGAELFNAKTDPEMRKERIRRFVSGGGSPT